MNHTDAMCDDRWWEWYHTNQRNNSFCSDCESYNLPSRYWRKTCWFRRSWLAGRNIMVNNTFEILGWPPWLCFTTILDTEAIANSPPQHKMMTSIHKVKVQHSMKCQSTKNLLKLKPNALHRENDNDRNAQRRRCTFVTSVKYSLQWLMRQYLCVCARRNVVCWCV